MSEASKNIVQNLNAIREEIVNTGVHLVAVSKTKTVEDIKIAYDAGQRAFGENLVQEILDKKPLLPDDIEWHMIGHLQRNKVKYIAEFIHCIHGVDSLNLLQEIDKQAKKHNRVVDCLLQIHIAEEDSKFGFDFVDLVETLMSPDFPELPNVRIRGLMGIATLTEKEKEIREEFHELKSYFESLKKSFFNGKEYFDTLSMGMSSDYKIAISEGSNLIRVGSTIFGKRIIKHFSLNKNKENSADKKQ